jgi:DNA mismatch endonuclease (patch repair protein)
MVGNMKGTLSLGGGMKVPYPVPSSRAATAVMKGNRSQDTRPEVLLRSALHQRGLRFRKDYRISAKGASRRADIVFTRWRVAVFVDGCFWHRCPQHGRTPTSNRDYWDAKLTRNAERDRETDASLISAGWRVVRIWEHEPLGIAVDSIEAALGVRSGTTAGTTVALIGARSSAPNARSARHACGNVPLGPP